MNDDLNNTPHQAVALQWTPLQDDIPKITATGTGALADTILRLAKKSDIPIREDRDLIQVLSLLNVGEGIPPEIHTAIAEILVFIYWTNQQYVEIFNQDER